MWQLADNVQRAPAWQFIGNTRPRKYNSIKNHAGTKELPGKSS